MKIIIEIVIPDSMQEDVSSTLSSMKVYPHETTGLGNHIFRYGLLEKFTYGRLLPLLLTIKEKYYESNK